MANQSQLPHFPSPVQNENVGSLVHKLLRISKQWQQRIKPSVQPFHVQSPVRLHSCPWSWPCVSTGINPNQHSFLHSFYTAVREKTSPSPQGTDARAGRGGGTSLGSSLNKGVFTLPWRLISCPPSFLSFTVRVGRGEPSFQAVCPHLPGLEAPGSLKGFPLRPLSSPPPSMLANT